MPTPSARQAAWLLAGVGPPPPLPASRSRVSAGEAERLELVDLLATRMLSRDPAERAVCRRLLEHLRGPQSDRITTSRLQ